MRAQLTIFETGDATLEQVAVAADHKRKEESQLLVAQQTKKVRCATLFAFLPLNFSWDKDLKLFLAGPLPCTLQEEARCEFGSAQEAKDRWTTWRDRGLRPLADEGKEGRLTGRSPAGKPVVWGMDPC